MKLSKNPRQSRILHILKTQNIGTQEELVQALSEQGMDVTQATISRDIKELGIIKVATADGRQKYIPMSQSGENASGRLMKVFAEAVIHIDRAGQFVILKTLPGMAQAAASALDSMHLEELMGSIAGDDTVFLATQNKENAEAVLQDLMVFCELDRQEEPKE